jgi:hypothetical protein
MSQYSVDIQRLYDKAAHLKDNAIALRTNFSFKGLFCLVQEVADVVEQEYGPSKGLIKKQVAIEIVLDLYNKNKWDIVPGVPSFIEKKVLNFLVNRAIDYVVEVLNKYVWNK